MATKTISLTVEAYDKLRNARRHAHESFSQVVLRASWPEETVTGEELLTRLREGPSRLSVDELDAIDRVKQSRSLPEDKWTTP